MDYSTREGVAMPQQNRRAVVFCTPVDNTTVLAQPNKAVAPALLALPQYTGLDTMALIAKATARLVTKKLAIRTASKVHHLFLNPVDRLSAIAVLEGIR